MAKSLSIFNFKKSPKAFFLSFALIVATNIIMNCLIDYLVVNNIWQISSRRKEYIDALRKGRKSNGRASGLILGSSVAQVISPEQFSKELSLRNGEILNLAVGGGMPRTFLYVLEDIKFNGVKSDGLVFLVMIPMDLNRYNKCFKLTIVGLFTWKNFFVDLLSHGRIDNAIFFLKNRAAWFASYRYEIRRLFANLLNENERRAGKSKGRDKPDKELTTKEMNAYRNDYLINYTIDPYQVEAVEKIVDGLSVKNRTIIVLFPISKAQREILGKINLERFVDTISSVAKRKNVFMIDYESKYRGDEYEYLDGAHLTTGSSEEFVKQLARDVLIRLGQK